MHARIFERKHVTVVQQLIRIVQRQLHASRFIFSVLIISLGPLLCGISLGFSSSVSAQLLIGDQLLAFFSSVINLGALLGSLFVGHLLTTKGRRLTLRLAALPSVLGWSMIAAAQDLHPPVTYISPTLVVSLICGRLLTGLAAGMMTAVGSVYLVEVAPPAISGRIATLAQCAIVAGTCVAYYCGMVALWYETARLMVLLSIVMFFSSFYLPESPVWLAKSGNLQAALQDLTWLRADSRIAAMELAGSSSPPPSLDKHPLSPQDLSKKPTPYNLSNKSRERPATLIRLIGLVFPCITIPAELRANLRIAMMLMLAQQATGINIITFFTETICQRMVHVAYSAKCAFSIGVAQLCFSITASLLIDRFPRRMVIFATGTLMATSMFFFAIGLRYPEVSPISPMVSLMCFLFGYCFGWGPLAMLITLELFPAPQRGAAGGSAVAVSWIATFLVTQAYQPLVAALGGGESGEVAVFLLFCAMTMSFVVFFHRALPETNQAFVQQQSLKESSLKAVV